MIELKDVKFMTAQDKARVLRQWRNFIRSGLKWEAFHKALYEHLYLHCGFIAHYNRQGFYATYFEDGQDTLAFFNFFTYEQRGHSDYADLKQAMNEVLKQYEPQIRRDATQKAISQIDDKIAILQALKLKLA